MIFDCFTFFNELDLLEIRLNELHDVVDKFVLVEATRTFQKKPKPLFFQENKERYQPFLDKIEHVVVNQYPSFFKKFRVPNTWDYENYQREQIIQGLRKAQAQDTIIISDLDEIPKPEKILEWKDKAGYHVFEQRLYFYFLNGLSTFYDAGNEATNQTLNRDGIGFWRGTVMMKFEDFIKKIKTVKKARMLRGLPEHEINLIRDAGWHFSYLGGIEKIIQKLEAYSHSEFNTDYYKNPERLKEIISKGEDLFGTKNKFEFIKLDETLPLYLQQNAGKYAHLINLP